MATNMKAPLLVLGTALLLSGCMVRTIPDSAGGVASSPDFLRDAAATCGNRTMLMPESRDYESTTTLDRTNKIYDCVHGYLKASPEYQKIGPAAQANDRSYIEQMRQIDLQRAAGRLSAVQAKDAALRANAVHNGR